MPKERAECNSREKSSKELDDIGMGSDTMEPLYLLVCMEGRNGSNQLHQLDISHTKPDKLLCHGQIGVSNHTRIVVSISLLMLFKRNTIHTI